MGSKISVSEENKQTTKRNLDNDGRKECHIRNKRKPQRTILQCCSNDFVTSANTTPEVEMIPKVKKSRKTAQSPRNSAISNVTTCKIFTNKISIQKLRQSERGSHLAAFFRLFDDDYIQDFLWLDRCYMLCDKYLLAMVYAYFRRASVSLKEYTRMQFFVALYLAHEMEEDDEDLKMEIYPWAICSTDWRRKISGFTRRRNHLLQRMKYRAVVSKQTCEEIFALFPRHPAWQRERRFDHGGGFRYDNDADSVFSPSKNQMKCRVCGNDESSFTSGYVSNCSENTFARDTSLPHDDNPKVCLYDSDEQLLFPEE